MDLDELRSVQRTERQKDSLQHLRDSFYADVAAYIEERKAERKRAAADADDPFGDPAVGELTDEIETAEEVVEAIYERRVGKVVKLASFAAADMSADTNGLTAEERALFDDLVGRIKQSRQTILDVLAGEGSPAVDQTEPADAPPGQAASDRASAQHGSPATTAPGVSEATADTTDSAATTNAANATDAANPADPTNTASPDDVLAEAMGGPSSESDQEAPEEPAPGDSAATTGSATAPDPPAGRSDPSAEPDAGHPSDGGGPAVPPDAPPDAAATEAPVVGAEAEDATESEPTETEHGERTARDGGLPADSVPDASPPTGGSEGPEARGGSGDDTERLTLRITEDVGRIFGVDEREYDLAAEDVVTLPSTNAGPLIERDAAERLE
ncbi:DNA replication complex subunit Gins51 [Halobellus clavatus]|jgi:DNA replication factor GINS|uniref:DNA replication factor GINS n=1 Tax=Halobellus clavatus TaxID=660517 RepID=A0A1H3EZ16_9EURY|nr:hypothetical protein [Halobellus clavatus]SDX84062.1 DNA replication factor GINS [Halobellus clavatus]